MRFGYEEVKYVLRTIIAGYFDTDYGRERTTTKQAYIV